MIVLNGSDSEKKSEIVQPGWGTRIMLIVLIVACIALFFLLYLFMLKELMIDIGYDTLKCDVVHSQQEVQSLSKAEETLELLSQIYSDSRISLAGIALQHTAVSEVGLDTVLDFLKDYNPVVYRFPETDTDSDYSDFEVLSLSPSDLRQLADKGVYQEGTDIYYQFSINDTPLVVRLSVPGEQAKDFPIKLFNSGNSVLFAVDQSTGAIYSSSAFFSSYSLSDFTWLENWVVSAALPDATDYAIFSLPDGDDTEYFCVHAPTEIGIEVYAVCPLETLTGIDPFLYIIPAALILVYILSYLLLFRKLNKNYITVPEEKDFVRFTRRIGLYLPLTKENLKQHVFMFIINLLAYALLMILFLSVYLSGIANSKLDSLTALLEYRSKTSEEITTAYDKTLLDEVGIIASLLCVSSENSELLGELTASAGLANNSIVTEITLFDENGYIEASSSNEVGYHLSKDPSDLEYPLWSLLNGEASSMITPADSEGLENYYAVRRQDKVGIVRLRASSFPPDVLNGLSVESTIRSAYIGSSMLAYCLPESKNQLYVRSSTAPDVLVQHGDFAWFWEDSPTIDNMFLLNQFCLSSIRTYTDRNVQEIILVCGIPISHFLLAVMEASLAFLLLLIFLSFLLHYTFWSFHATLLNTERPIMDFSQLRSFIDEETAYYSLLKRSMLSVPLTIVFALLINSLVRENSIIDFLRSDSWRRGINVFSLTNILIISLISKGACQLIDDNVKEKSSSVPAGAVARLQLRGSVFKTLIVCIGIIISLFQINVDITAILASIGIVSLAISIGAKDTVNDFIAGLFLILDGSIKIGDYVQVGNFTGIVLHIGIRTTQIRYNNKEKYIPNSSMKDVLNYSIGPGLAISTLTVSNKIPPAEVERLFYENRLCFYAACGQLLMGEPVYLGLSSTDSYENAKYDIALPCREEDADMVKRRGNEVLLTFIQHYKSESVEGSKTPTIS